MIGLKKLLCPIVHGEHLYEQLRDDHGQYALVCGNCNHVGMYYLKTLHNVVVRPTRSRSLWGVTHFPERMVASVSLELVARGIDISPEPTRVSIDRQSLMRRSRE